MPIIADKQFHFALPASASGTLSKLFDVAGDRMLIQLDKVTIATITHDASRFVFDGVPGTAGESLGHLVSTSVRDVNFTTEAGHGLYVQLQGASPEETGDGIDSSIFVGSGEFNDLLDLGALYPGKPAIAADAGAGDDIVLGSAGNDVIAASAGNDLLDGDDGLDTVSFRLVVQSGGKLQRDFDQNGNQLIRVDGKVAFIVARNIDGSYVVTGQEGTAGAAFGAETLRNIEKLAFTTESRDGETLFDALEVHARIETVGGIHIGRHVADDGWAMGTDKGDTIALAKLFPGIVVPSGYAMAGVTVDAGGGDDRVTGTAADDHLYASAGKDVLDGGAGRDDVIFALAAGTTGTLGVVHFHIGAQDGMTITLDDKVILTVTAQGNGGYLVEGMHDTAGAAFGTETLTGIEQLRVAIDGDAAGNLAFIDLEQLVPLVGVAPLAAV